MTDKENEIIEKEIQDSSAESESESEKNLTEQLVELVLTKNVKLFHDQFDNGFIAVEEDGHKTLKLRSRGFKSWLSHLGWNELGKAVSSGTIETAVRTLEGHATHDSEEIKLHVRIAETDDGIAYDLGDGRAVLVNKDEWKILDPAPILFYRFGHQRLQVAPIPGAEIEIENVFNFIPTPKEPRQKLLLLIWLVASVLPNFPHPILVVHGPQGSRKTTLFKLLRGLIDPSIMETLTAHGDSREYVQLASHHYFLPLDNLSPIKPEFSDLLCRTVTGEGMSKRELYSDDDDIIYSFRRVVAMNGINLVVSKPDLLERSLIIELERPQNYKEEGVLMAEFEQARPQLLGAIISAVQKSIKVYPEMELPEQISNFRMADFVRWGCAISIAIGHTAEEFIDALTQNLIRQNAEAIDDSPVAQVVIAFMEDKTHYQATPTDLLLVLQELAIKLKQDTRQREFPKTPNWLWRRLQVVATNLMALGIKVSRDKDGARLITFTKIYESGVNAVSGVMEDSDEADVDTLNEADMPF